MSSKRKITDLNLYALLEVPSTATEQEIKKAYRKRALKCHPDKNPDNPNAATLFLELSDALEILTDEKARAAYDKTLKAKELAKEREQLLGAKRRKLKEDLERREREARESSSAASASANSNLDELNLMREVERLRREGSSVLKEQQEYIRSQLKSTLAKSTPPPQKASYGDSFSRFSTANTSASSRSSGGGDTTSSFEDFESMALAQLRAAAQKQSQNQSKTSIGESSSRNDKDT